MCKYGDKKLEDKQNTMEWYVFRYNINRKCIETFNVFDHGGFGAEVKNLLNKDMSKEDFTEELRIKLLYYYWSKCQWEILIKPWVGDYSVEKKVDVYNQIMLNWKQFVNYVWSFRKEK